MNRLRDPIRAFNDATPAGPAVTPVGYKESRSVHPTPNKQFFQAGDVVRLQFPINAGVVDPSSVELRFDAKVELNGSQSYDEVYQEGILTNRRSITITSPTNDAFQFTYDGAPINGTIPGIPSEYSPNQIAEALTTAMIAAGMPGAVVTVAATPDPLTLTYETFAQVRFQISQSPDVTKNLELTAPNLAASPLLAAMGFAVFAPTNVATTPVLSTLAPTVTTRVVATATAAGTVTGLNSLGILLLDCTFASVFDNFDVDTVARKIILSQSNPINLGVFQISIPPSRSGKSLYKYFPSDGVSNVDINTNFTNRDASGAQTPEGLVDWTLYSNQRRLRPRFQYNILSCFSRARMLYGDTMVMDDVQEFGTISRWFSEWQDDRATWDSTGALSCNKSNVDVRQQIMFNAHNVPQSFVTKLPVGLLKQDRVIPLKYLGDQLLTLELTIRRDADCVMVDDGGAYFSFMKYQNFQLVYDTYELEPAREAVLFKQINNGGYPMPFMGSMTTYFQTIRTVNQWNLQYHHASSARLLVAGLVTKGTSFVADSDATFSYSHPSLLSGSTPTLTAGWTPSYLKDFSWKLDERTFPTDVQNLYNQQPTSESVGSQGVYALHSARRAMRSIDEVEMGNPIDYLRWAHPYWQIQQSYDATDPYGSNLFNRDVIPSAMTPNEQHLAEGSPVFHMFGDLVNFVGESTTVGTNLDKQGVLKFNLNFNEIDYTRESPLSVLMVLLHDKLVTVGANNSVTMIT